MSDPLETAASVSRGDRVPLRQWNGDGSALEEVEATIDQLGAALVGQIAMHPDIVERVQKTLSGTGAPSDSLGIDGDSYVDLVSGLTYRKASGTWSAVGRISLNPKGAYDAATNTPTLSAGGGGGAQGDVYFVSNAGTVAADSVGAVTPPDQIVHVGTAWVRVATSSTLGSMAGQDADAVDITGGQIAGETIVPQGLELFSDVILDVNGGVVVALDDSEDPAFRVRRFAADVAAIPTITVPLTVPGVIASYATIAAEPIIQDDRYHGGEALLDANGGALMEVGDDGRIHYLAVTAGSLRMTGTPTNTQDVVTVGYLQSQGTGGSIWLEPSANYNAPIDGVTDASTEVLACAAAAVLRGDRRIQVDHDYSIPNADDTLGNVIAVGRGSFVDAVREKLVVPADAPSPPPPVRTFCLRTHLPQLAELIRAGTSPIKVLITGDSTSGGNVTGVPWTATPQTLIVESLRRANPGVVFQFTMRGIGGTDWSELNSEPDWGTGSPPVWYGSAGTPWLDVMEPTAPHVVIIHMNRNRASTRRLLDILQVIAKIRGWADAPEVLLINSVGQVPESDSRRNYIEAGAGMMASMGLWWGPGVGVIDSLSEESVHRFGYHPGNMPLLADGLFLPVGSRQTSDVYLELPFTCPTPAYGWGGNFRIDANRWTTLGNELWFQIGNEDIADNGGCRFHIRRHQPSNEIQYKITALMASAGAAEDWLIQDWTSTGLTITNSDTTKFELHRQGNGQVIFNWRSGGSPSELAFVDTRIFQGFVPAGGGRFAMKIGCAAGTVTTGLKLATGSDGYSACLLALPRRETLFMPTITDREFAAPDDSPALEWGGYGPHPSELAGRLILAPTYNAQDWSAF